ncbi:MAG TPA: LysR family transcriptional regulator [Alphaproteobacteria bacterium]|nr:LysR family transcriptional regulator [Alphaproteobacteria bacterium]
MLINVTLRQLQVFVAVAQNQSYTRASRLIGISQPALTGNVRQLEAILDVRLLDRTTRMVRLTNEGQSFLPVAERLISDLQAAIADIRDSAEHVRGRVEVACLPSVAVQLIGPLMLRFRERYPGLVIKVYDGDAQSVARQVLMKEADFGVSSYYDDEPELDFIPLIRDRFCVICHRDHPLARKRMVRLKDLEAYPFIAMGTNTGTRRIVDNAAIRAHVKLNITCEAKQLSTLSGMVAVGIGVSILPEACLSNLTQQDLATCKLIAPAVERELGLMLRRGRTLGLGAQSFRDFIIENIGAYWKDFATAQLLPKRELARLKA